MPQEANPERHLHFLRDPAPVTHGDGPMPFEQAAVVSVQERVVGISAKNQVGVMLAKYKESGKNPT